MKLFILFIVVLFYPLYVSSQSFGGCGYIDTTNYSQGIVCDNASSVWLNKYRTPGYWIPQNNTPIKTILVNWIVCRDDNGENGWQDTQQFRDQVDLMFTHLNNWYSNSLPKGYDLTCEPTYTHISDSKIRFELNEIIFIDNTQFNESRHKADDIFNYLDIYHPTYKNYFNHIFTMPEDNNSYWGFYSNIAQRQIAYVETWYSMWSDWFVVWDHHINHIAHEYGHAVGLHHTYNGERRDINHFDFLDDIFGLCYEIGYCNPTPPLNHIC